jgi:transposase
MIRLAVVLPEYETVLSMYGVGEITAAQLMAEIGDMTPFPRRSSLIAFAGIAPDVDQSGKHDTSSTPTSKRGSSHLRKMLSRTVSSYIKLSSVDEPVYQFP